LAPIVDRPDQAVLPDATFRALRALLQIPGVTIAIVSGRSLDDVKSRIGIDGLIYSGNHGLEIEGPDTWFVHPRALALSDRLYRIVDQVAAAAISLDGVEIEWKRLTASVHYRRASAFARREILEILRDSPLARDRRFTIREGKKVYEIRPRVSWNKGDAVRLIQERQNLRDALVIVAGDDATDEDAFRVFDDAITICVAPRRQTAARHTLATCEDLRDFLSAVTDLRSQRNPGPPWLIRGLFPNGTSKTHAGPM
jgi:trehalose-phosphatase